MVSMIAFLAKISRSDVLVVVLLGLWLPLCLAAEEDVDDKSKQEEEIESGGLTGQILIGINDSFQSFKPLFKSWFMTLAAIGFILQWHLVPVLADPGAETPAKPSKFWRQIGLNTLVFQIYYAPQFSICQGKNFVSSVAFIFFDTVVLFYIIGMFRPEPKPVAGGGADLTADNWYKDITRQFRRCLLCFFAQGGLVMYYVFELNSDPKTHDESGVSMLEWIVALLIIEIAGDDEMGSSYDVTYWNTLSAALSDDAKNHWHFVVWSIPMPIKTEFMIRKFMDMVVNGVFRTMILGTAPIMLAVEGHMDFVKDCTALFFILKLDDITPVDLLTRKPEERKEMGDRVKEFGDSILKWVPVIGDFVQARALPNYKDVLLGDLQRFAIKHQPFLSGEEEAGSVSQ